jgi:hypothetical protein
MGRQAAWLGLVGPDERAMVLSGMQAQVDAIGDHRT